MILKEPMTHTGHPGIGISMLDRDHKMISELILDVNFLEVQGKFPSRKKRFFRRFSQLMLSHFALEEGMMRATRYPGLDAHLRKHQAIMQQIRGLSDGEGGQDVLEELSAGILWESHVIHVEKDDRALSQWLTGSPESILHDS